MLYASSILLALLSSLVSYVPADCQTIDGTPYSLRTDKIVYNGLGFSGSYNKVTNMDESSGSCSLLPFEFSGMMSPLDEELSVHFRGPLKLLQFGVYYPSSLSNSKRNDNDECSTLKRTHHNHKRAQTVYSHVTQTVHVDVDGNLLDDNSQSSTGSNANNTSLLSAASSSSESSGSGASGSWTRRAYYTPNNAQGLVFMNHQGGVTSSGVWLKNFGNSISYCNADATSGSANPVALGDVTVKSNTEYMIFSDTDCDSSCGYYRSGIPAKKGFGGKNKIFVFEFSMPTDNSGGFNSDMPSIWLLNAQIPRTLQYGKAECSCWTSGCGEVDLFEIVSLGQDKLLSHIHNKQGANGKTGSGCGSSDYFARPVSETIKTAVVFKELSIHILLVTEDFGSTLDMATVDAWIEKLGSAATIGY